MSIYATWLDYGYGDDPAPIVYRGSHVMPSDTAERGGAFDLAAIPAYVRDEDAPDEDAVLPWLRVSVNDSDVVLDLEQVRETHRTLGQWLERVAHA